MFDFYFVLVPDFKNSDKAENTPRPNDFRLDEKEIDQIAREIKHNTTRYIDSRCINKFVRCIYKIFCYIFFSQWWIKIAYFIDLTKCKCYDKIVVFLTSAEELKWI